MSLDDVRALMRRRRRADRSEAAPLPLPAAPGGAVAGTTQDESLAPRLAAKLDELRAREPELHASIARLNGAQQHAVCGDEPSLLVRAQVGSGKTTVLVHRVLYLHRVLGVPLRRMAVLTYTSKAAREVRQRVTELAGARADVPAGAPSDPRDFWLTGTFHGVARALLKRALPVERHGRTPRFRILDESDRARCLERLVAEHALGVRYRRRLGQRLERWRAGEPLFGVMKHEDDIARLASLYEDAKREQDGMDFDDLIAVANDLLSELADDLRPRWIVVDELQDCDERQLDFITRLAGPGTGVFAVGDPQQVIYTWRGSRPEVFEELGRRFAMPEITLPVNYRSTTPILEAARSVLGAAAAPLVGVRGEGAPIVVHRHHDALHEARFVAGRLRELAGDGLSWSDVAILFRTRQQARPFREVLGGEGIPVIEPHRGSRLDEPVVRWLRSLLAWLADPASGGGPPARLGDDPFGVGAPAARAMEARLSELRERLVAGQAFAAGELFREAALDRLLRPTSSRYQEHATLVGRILSRAADRAPSERLGAGEIARLADDLALGSFELPPEPQPAAGEAVALLTLHAAKGLEFRHVFISGANLGLVPLASSFGSPDRDAEERRLLFVGLTRARDGVEISWHTAPESHSGAGEPSPYLAALPAAVVERRDRRTAAAGADPVRSSPWREGLAVRHRQYGRGVVERVADATVVCRFDTVGSKSFSTFFCPLEVL